ncbi:MAG: SGNH/GDSL hydrolase family protein [Balneolaceae bacterium]
MTYSNPSTQTRAVFLGDSITKEWADSNPEFFSKNLYKAKGINGETTSQILTRFNTDVLDLNSKVVVVLAGTNDIAGNSGPTSNEMIQANLSKMCDLAIEHDIKVILCSILPTDDYPWRKGLKPAQRIIDINTWMKAYCIKKNHSYLDYWSAMAHENKGMKNKYTYDGVHITQEGYKVMEKLVEPLITETLSKRF